MDGYTYLILQTLPIVSAVAFAFCLMGLYFGSTKYRRQLAEAEATKATLTGELSELRKGKNQLAKELKEVRDELRQSKSGSAKPKAQTQEVVQRQAAPLAPAISKSTLEKESQTTAAELDLGQIYSEAPDTVDDLKKVRGIAKVMEGKLNEAGIYTYAQIARWSDGAAAEFGRRMGIAGNVERLNWRSQCASLHKDKYHEDV